MRCCHRMSVIVTKLHLIYRPTWSDINPYQMPEGYVMSYQSMHARIKISPVPCEAGLAVVAPLTHWQHVGVRRAGEQQLPDFKRPGNAQTSAFLRTVKLLESLDAARHCAAPGSPSLWMTTHSGGERVGCGTSALLQVLLGRHPDQWWFIWWHPEFYSSHKPLCAGVWQMKSLSLF